jgi:hypothetical protein
MVQLLIDHGFNASIEYYSQPSLLAEAILAGHVNFVSHLLNKVKTAHSAVRRNFNVFFTPNIKLGGTERMVRGSLERLLTVITTLLYIWL